MIDDRAIELERLVKGAALDSGKWVAALDAVNAFVGGSGVGLLCVESRERFAPASSDMAEMVEDYFANGWSANDRREACIPLLKANGIVFDHEFQSEQDIVGCDYYHDFLARHDRKWFAGIGVEIDGDSWCLALQRSPKLGAFDGGDLPRLRLVRSVLAESALLARHIGHVWMSGLQHALDAMTEPAIVFDDHARVSHCNDAAIAIVGGSIGRDRSLRLGSARDQAAFERMLGGALSPLRRGSHAEAATAIRWGGRTYSCRATSLLSQQGLIATRAAVLVVIAPVVEDPASLLKRRFGLTDAETRVAIALSDGKSVAELAADHRVAIATIRGQLKSIFQKLDVDRQSKLVAFVHKLAID